MTVETSVKHRSLWLSSTDDSGVVISSRVRLARNLLDFPFPGWADDKTRQQVLEVISPAFAGLKSLPKPLMVDVGRIDEIDRLILAERHLISNELAEKNAGAGLVVAEDEGIAIMINEEDHLRLQAMAPGLDLVNVWRRIDAVDSELEERLPFAYSHTLGYLSACPSNVGTGMRASVMLHLGGLRLTGDIDGVICGLERLGFAVRGLMGEGTEASGDLFQVSNQGTLGGAEEAIIDRLLEIVDEVVRHEVNARMRVLESRREYLLDYVGRAYGVLMHARVLSSREAVDFLSAMRLGVELGLVKHLTVMRINETMLMTQPGHLQRLAGAPLASEDRDLVRAGMVRRKLRGVAMAE